MRQRLSLFGDTLALYSWQESEDAGRELNTFNHRFPLCCKKAQSNKEISLSATVVLWPTLVMYSTLEDACHTLRTANQVDLGCVGVQPCKRKNYIVSKKPSSRNVWLYISLEPKLSRNHIICLGVTCVLNLPGSFGQPVPVHPGITPHGSWLWLLISSGSVLGTVMGLGTSKPRRPCPTS